MAFTAAGPAAVVREPLESAANVLAVELRVERLQDHLADGRTEMLGAAGWRWRDERAAADEPRILAELEELARAGGGEADGRALSARKLRAAGKARSKGSTEQP